MRKQNFSHTPTSTFQSWLQGEQKKKAHFVASPATSISGQVSCVQKAILSQQAKNVGFALTAVHIHPDVAQHACDKFKGLHWYHEVNKDGSETGFMGLVYAYDPSVPHEHTLACFREAIRTSIVRTVGLDFAVKAVSSRRSVEEDVTMGKEEDAQFYGQGQNLDEDEDGYGIALQVAFQNESHKYLAEECFFSVSGTKSTQVSYGVRVHTLTDSEDHPSPIQYFTFAISWLACLDVFVFHGGLFSGDSSECLQPGNSKYLITTRVDPIVQNTSKEEYCGMMGTMDLHAICDEATAEIISRSKGLSASITQTPTCWKANCLQATREVIQERSLVMERDVPASVQHELLCHFGGSDM